MDLPPVKEETSLFNTFLILVLIVNYLNKPDGALTLHGYLWTSSTPLIKRKSVTITLDSAFHREGAEH